MQISVQKGKGIIIIIKKQKQKQNTKKKKAKQNKTKQNKQHADFILFHNTPNRWSILDLSDVSIFGCASDSHGKSNGR